MAEQLQLPRELQQLQLLSLQLKDLARGGPEQWMMGLLVVHLLIPTPMQLRLVVLLRMNLAPLFGGGRQLEQQLTLPRHHHRGLVVEAAQPRPARRPELSKDRFDKTTSRRN